MKGNNKKEYHKKTKNFINSDKIKKELSKLLINNISQTSSTLRLKKIDREAINILYNNGFDDNQNNFKPVIYDINYKFNFNREERCLTISFKSDVDSDWVEISSGALENKL